MIIVNQGDFVTLSHLLQSYDETIGTKYVRAIVYDDNNNALNGSPFELSLVGNNLYVKRNAFQANIDNGTYKVIYEVYDDASFTTKSAEFSQDHEIVQVQSSGGGVYLSGSDMGGQVDLSGIERKLEKISKRLEKVEKKEDKDTKKIIKEIKEYLLSKKEIEDVDFSWINREFESVKEDIKSFKGVILDYFSSVFDKNKETNFKIDDLYENIEIFRTSLDQLQEEITERITKEIIDSREEISQEVKDEIERSFSEYLKNEMVKAFIVGNRMADDINLDNKMLAEIENVKKQMDENNKKTLRKVYDILYQIDNNTTTNFNKLYKSLK